MKANHEGHNDVAAVDVNQIDFYEAHDDTVNLETPNNQQKRPEPGSSPDMKPPRGPSADDFRFPGPLRAQGGISNSQPLKIVRLRRA